MAALIQMQLFVIIGVTVFLVFMTFLGPTVTAYTRKQWALLMMTLFVLWTPMGYYLLFVVSPSIFASGEIAPRSVALVGLVNLVVGVPLFIVIGRRILKQGR